MKYINNQLENTASLRTPLGNAQVIECLSKLLEKVSGQQPDFQLQALRVLGNLCFDNGKPLYSQALSFLTDKLPQIAIASG